MAAVDVESLTITYGNVTAVDDLSFRAEAGEVTCVLGPNGAGKTSTLESLEGLRRPSAGRLRVIGLDPHAEHAALTERIGVMLQEGGIHPAVRVREVLRHAAALYPDPLDPRALIDRLGLAGLERRTYRQLSGGEQQRLALALALVGRPQVAFLDEPTAGVDPAGRQVIRQVVADLRNDGVAVLLTTHDLDEAERVADRVVIVVGGRLVGAGTVDELTRASGGDERVRFRAPAGLDRDSLVRHLGGTTVVEVAPGEYVVAAEPTPRTVAAITAWLAEHDLPLADLRAGRQRLEDVYLRLTAEDAEPADAAAGSRAGSSRRRRRGRPSGPTAHDRADHDPVERDRDRDRPDAAADSHDPDETDSVDHDRDDPDQTDSVERDRDDLDQTDSAERERDRDQRDRDQPDADSDDGDHVDSVDEGDPATAAVLSGAPDEPGSAPSETWRQPDSPTSASRPDDSRDAARGTAATVGGASDSGDGAPTQRTDPTDQTTHPDDDPGAPTRPRPTDDRAAGPSGDDRGLTASTFEAFWGRGRFRGDADQADDTAWAGWADAPGDPRRAPAPSDPDGTPAASDPADTPAPGRAGAPRRGRRRRR